jgi:hypothetical protein
MGIHNYIYIIYIYCVCNTRTDTMQYTQQLRGPQVLKRSKTKDKGFKEWLFIWICGKAFASAMFNIFLIKTASLQD